MIGQAFNADRDVRYKTDKQRLVLDTYKQRPGKGWRLDPPVNVKERSNALTRTGTYHKCGGELLAFGLKSLRVQVGGFVCEKCDAHVEDK